jgi:hypothetical protein
LSSLRELRRRWHKMRLIHCVAALHRAWWNRQEITPGIGKLMMHVCKPEVALADRTHHLVPFLRS